MTPFKLLTREEFKAQVFERDGGLCVLCKAPAVDAHHIMDRKLFSDGGYYLHNGAAVCESCHHYCEDCTYSPERVRAAAGIYMIVLPASFNAALRYNKWGEVVTEHPRVDIAPGRVIEGTKP